MSAFPSTANPIFYAQFNSRGGWRNTLIVAGAYAVIIGGLIWAMVASDTHPKGVYEGWLNVLIALQVLGLVVYGSLRVSTSVRSDINSKLLESHRLMPLSPTAASVGYMLGAPAQVLVVAAVNVLIGLFVAAGAHVAIDHWLVVNIMLASFVLMCWSVTAFLAFVTRGGFALLAIGVLISVMGGGEALSLFPGLTVLTAPIIGRSVFELKTGLGDLDYGYVVSLISQLVFAAIFLVATARKYRSSEKPGFSGLLGLLLLGAASAISAIGLAFPDSFFKNYAWTQRESEVPYFVASAVALMLVSWVPLTSAAIERAQRRQSAADGREGGWSLPLMVVTVAAIGLCCVLLRIPPRLGWGSRSLLGPARICTATIFAASTLSVAALVAWATIGRRNVKPLRIWIILFLWFLILWIAPLIADAAQRSVNGQDTNSLGVIGTLSPIGALSVTWDRTPHEALIGIYFQWVMLILPVVLLIIARWRRRAVAGAESEAAVQLPPA